MSCMLTMQALARKEDLSLDSERRLTCRGSARVRLEYLRWNETRTANKKHKEILQKAFRQHGCRPMEVPHHIPAIVDRQQLDTALEDARRKGKWQTNTLPTSYSTIDFQEGYPELEFPEGLTYLHGLHRIEAWKECFSPAEKWWIVDLYLSDISYKLKIFLIEEYNIAETPSDGVIFRKMMEYRRLSMTHDCSISSATCYSFEMRWQSRLKGNRKRNLDGFNKNGQLKWALYRFSLMTGLCDSGLRMTTMHKASALKCPDWIGNYFKWIEMVWGLKGFLKGIADGERRVDHDTVKAVELRAPGVSTLDAKALHGPILGGTIFRNFSCHEREIIWDNIKAFKGIVPSLYTFFKDLGFLELCVDGIKRLVTVGTNETVLTTLISKLKDSRVPSQLVQISETAFKPESWVNGQLLALQVAAYAMRDYQKMPKAPVRKNLKAKARPTADPEVLQGFATLARQLGFESDEIETLRQHPIPRPTVEDARDDVPLLVTSGPGVPIKERCGIPPRADIFEEDRKYLFLHNLCEDRDETGEGITSFFVLKSQFAFFFKPTPWGRGMSVKSSDPPPPAPQQDLNKDLHMKEAEEEPDHQEQRVSHPWQGDSTEEIQKTNPAEVETTQAIEGDQEREEFSGTSPVDDFQSLITTPVLEKAQTIIPVVTGVGPITIYFAEGKGSESDIMDPIKAHDCILSLTVDLDDPNSLVELEQQVRLYLQKGIRICDRGWNYFAVQDCYAVATDPKNGNSLFLVPEKIREETKVQDYVELNGGNQAMQRQSQLQEETEQILQDNKNDEARIQARNIEAKLARQKTEERLQAIIEAETRIQGEDVEAKRSQQEIEQRSQAINEAKSRIQAQNKELQRVQEETEHILQDNKNDEARIQAGNIEAKLAQQKTKERLQAIIEAEAQIRAQDIEAKRSQQETEQRLQANKNDEARIQAQNKELERVQQETELELRNAKVKEATERDLAEKEYRKEKDREDEIEEAVSDLLEEARVNSANSRILDKTITIYFKERIGPSHDVSKPAGAWEWKYLREIEVPMGDPHGLILGKVNHLWSKANLQPHNSDLKKLKHEDCYMAAEEDREHTLYFMPKTPQEQSGLELGLHRTPAQLSKHREKIGRGLDDINFAYTKEDTSPQIRKRQNGKRTADNSANTNPYPWSSWSYATPREAPVPRETNAESDDGIK